MRTRMTVGRALFGAALILGVGVAPALADPYYPTPHERWEWARHHQYYAPPLVAPGPYYAAPPVVYGPPVGFNVVVPLHIR